MSQSAPFSIWRVELILIRFFQYYLCSYETYQNALKYLNIYGIYRSNLILTIERRYIEFFKKVDFEKNQQTTKIMKMDEKLRSRQRVNRIKIGDEYNTIKNIQHDKG